MSRLPPCKVLMVRGPFDPGDPHGQRELQSQLNTALRYGNWRVVSVTHVRGRDEAEVYTAVLERVSLQRKKRPLAHQPTPKEGSDA